MESRSSFDPMLAIDDPEVVMKTYSFDDMCIGGFRNRGDQLEAAREQKSATAKQNMGSPYKKELISEMPTQQGSPFIDETTRTNMALSAMRTISPEVMQQELPATMLPPPAPAVAGVNPPRGREDHCCPGGRPPRVG